MKTRADLKMEVKQLFKGRWRQAVILCLVVSIVTAFNSVVQMKQQVSKFTDGSIHKSVLSQIFNLDLAVISMLMTIVLVVLIFSLVVGLVVKVITIGTSYTLLDWLRDPQREIHPVADATVGFSKQYGWPLVGLIIWQTILVFLWSLLLIVPGIIKSYAYTQSYFVYKDMLAATPADQPRPTYRAAITRSRELMAGYKFDYFVLQLSFLGWRILASLTAGIGQLWLVPYTLATEANYYENLVANAKLAAK
ncbi:DUF975 family protein [Lactiplantibacillus fabifermentans]|uniref:Membrane protein n=2 Tax=Lactiplantibacillus fabifermentans TaxID=483011 RepID=W6TCW7_9LACO|nr:DUF975 family protein [Lactiplantibacillus fabifermentans]ETY75110.1 membrane protein [Lactiplantibacillus fabifermentans T30PCM01]